jgi:DNA-binding beta-propeller fold protein YncE
VLVADSAEQRVEVFDALSYNYVRRLGTTGSAGSGNNQFSSPAGITIDTSHQRVLIGDQQNNRVQVFSIGRRSPSPRCCPARARSSSASRRRSSPA